MQNLLLLSVTVAAGLLMGEAMAVEMPAAPKMPAPAPGKNTQPAQQPTPEQLKQMQREHQQKRNTKPRKPNEQQPFGGGKDKGKEQDGEVTITGMLEKGGGTSPGEPVTYSIKDKEGKNYSLDGKESTLLRLVGKTVELTGETDKKLPTGTLKVKSVHEAKADGKPDEKKAAKT